jgi:cytochrome c oxidase cbb3-type subunit 3
MNTIPRILHASLIATVIVTAGCGGGSGDASMNGEQSPADVATFSESPEAVAAGERIFHAQSCIRCHKDSDPPGIGPSFHDTEWRYGGEPEQIYESIMNGRPRGMSPYAGRLSSQEVWYLVAYVRSLSKAAG